MRSPGDEGTRFFAALRMTGTGGCPAGDGGAGGAEPRPYGVDGNAEIIKWAIRESPLRGLSKQEGVIKGETRCCPP